MGIFLIITILLFGIILLSGMTAAIVANYKGYRPWFWILSMGPVGLILIVVKRGLNQAPTPEQRELWETRSDWTGGILSCLTFFMGFGLPFLGAALFLVARSAPIAPPPAVMARPTPATSSAEAMIVPPEDRPPAEQPADPAPEAGATPNETQRPAPGF